MTSTTLVLRSALALPAMALLTACSVFGVQNVDEAAYTVLRADDAVEIRQYPDLTLVTTTVRGDYDDTSREAFGRLFDYISGENAGNRKIEMTAPVIQESDAATEGLEIAMTAPVIQERSSDEASNETWKMAFVLPAEFSIDTAPKPTNPDVTLEVRSGGTFAVRTFSGFLSESDIAEATAVLSDWIAANGLKTAGAYASAGYDPPWTLPFARRNEIQVRLKTLPRTDRGQIGRPDTGPSSAWPAKP